MTCIAFKAGVMAADSRISGQYNSLGVKLFKRRDTLIGFAGDVSQGLVFVDWYFDREQRKPDLSEEKDWCALVVSVRGIEYWDCSLRAQPIPEKIAAIGSGAPFAIGAMDAGRSAREAVAIACRRDPGCGPPIFTARLNSSRKGK